MSDALQITGWMWQGVIVWDKKNSRATPGKPVPTTSPVDPVKEKIYLDKQFTAKDGNTYTARYMVRVFKNPGMQPDIYFMNCRK